VLAHVDDDPEAMAEADQVEDRLHQLETRMLMRRLSARSASLGVLPLLILRS